MPSMDSTQERPESRECITARETSSGVPKTSSKNPQDEAHPNPLAAIPGDDGSSPHSIDSGDAATICTSSGGKPNLETSMSEARSASCVSGPASAEDIDSLIRSLESSIKHLDAANKATSRTLANLQLTYRHLRGEITRWKDAVTEVPTRPRIGRVKNMESRVSSGEPTPAEGSVLVPTMT